MRTTEPTTRSSRGRGRRIVALAAGRRVRLTAVIAGCALLIPAVAAQATTGSDALNRKPIFTVTGAQAKPFLGGYTSTAHGTGIIASTLRTGYNTQGYLEGSISVTQYSEGQPATYLATLYEYRRSGSKMLVDLWTPDLGSARIGLLAVSPTSGGGLTGTLTTGQSKTHVTFKPIAAGAAQSKISSGVQSSSGGATAQSLTDSTENAGVFSTAVVAAASLQRDANPGAASTYPSD